MSYNRKQFDKKKLTKLASECRGVSGGCYYDKSKGRYIRFYKSKGKHSYYAKHKRIARRKSRLFSKRYNVYIKKANTLWC